MRGMPHHEIMPPQLTRTAKPCWVYIHCLLRPVCPKINSIMNGDLSAKKLIVKSRERHNHKLQPTPDTKRKRKITKQTCTNQTNKCTRNTQTSSLFPKQGDHNAKRNDETRGQRAQEDFFFHITSTEMLNSSLNLFYCFSVISLHSLLWPLCETVLRVKNLGLHWLYLLYVTISKGILWGFHTFLILQTERQ